MGSRGVRSWLLHRHVHTSRLGVPVVQLIEPIYIWIGAPLARVLFFLGHLIKAFKRCRDLLRQELQEARRTPQFLKARPTLPFITRTSEEKVGQEAED
jgi:hypothetical protein